MDGKTCGGALPHRPSSWPAPFQVFSASHPRDVPVQVHLWMGLKAWMAQMESVLLLHGALSVEHFAQAQVSTVLQHGRSHQNGATVPALTRWRCSERTERLCHCGSLSSFEGGVTSLQGRGRCE